MVGLEGCSHVDVDGKTTLGKRLQGIARNVAPWEDLVKDQVEDPV